MKPEQSKSLQDWALAYYRGSQEYATRLKSKWTPEWVANFADYVNTVHEFAGREAKVLEVGCGGGQCTYLIAAGVQQVIGVDISTAGLQGRPAQPENVTFQEADASALPFADKSFDLVASNATLEHLADAEKALEEAVRVLKPGGWLIVFGPNMISPVRLVSLTLKGLRFKKWHPDARPSFWLQALWLNLLKSLGFHRTFVYRQPLIDDLSFPGSDWDAICLASTFDLLRFSRQHQLEVVRFAQGTTRVGKFVARWLPWLAGGVGLVARKP